MSSKIYKKNNSLINLFLVLIVFTITSINAINLFKNESKNR